jgi:hypothetical protein
MRTLIPLSFVSLAALTACYEVDCDDSTGVSDAPVSEDTGDIGDIENPFAYVGEAHNVYLDCTLDYDPADVDETLAVLVDDCGFDSRTYEPSEFLLGLPDIFKQVDDTLYQSGVNVGMGADDLEILARADVILRNHSPEEAAVRLADLEQEALRADSSDALLGGMATLRSSNDFWMNELDGEDAKAGAKWWQIVLADAAGAIVGGVTAGPGGAIALGTTASTLVAGIAGGGNGGGENPYAYVGERHNEFLACTIEYDVRDAKSALKVLFGDCGFDAKDYGYDQDDLLYSMNNAFIHVPGSMYESGVNADLERDELELLARVDVVLRHSEPEEAAELLAELEQDALAMDGSEALLSGMATVRASNEFWMDEWDGDDDAEGRRPWWQIVLADAAGAIVGGATAGPGGAIALGTTASTLVAKD